MTVSGSGLSPLPLGEADARERGGRGLHVIPLRKSR